jgi:hypothetical protein
LGAERNILAYEGGREIRMEKMYNEKVLDLQAFRKYNDVQVNENEMGRGRHTYLNEEIRIVDFDVGS